MKPFTMAFCALLTGFMTVEHLDNGSWIATPQERQKRLDDYDHLKERHLPSEKYDTRLTHPPRFLTAPSDPILRKFCREHPKSEACER